MQYMGTLVTLFLQLAEKFFLSLQGHRLAVTLLTCTNNPEKHAPKILYKATKNKTRYDSSCKGGMPAVGHFRRELANPAKKTEHTYNNQI
jgi:hypothetical protein